MTSSAETQGGRGIACAVTKGAGGAASASRSFGHAPASGPPAAVLRPAVAPMQLVRCCPASDGTANLWSWGTFVPTIRLSLVRTIR